jgi:hypothetical protein
VFFYFIHNIFFPEILRNHLVSLNNLWLFNVVTKFKKKFNDLNYTRNKCSNELFILNNFILNITHRIILFIYNLHG